MSDLDELLAERWREREDAVAGLAAGVEPLVAHLGARVHRRRMQRRVVEGVVALPIAAGLALGGWSLAGQLDRHAPVVQSPDPGPTTSAPSPSETAPSPTQTPSPTQAAPVPLPAEPGLPDRLAAPDGILDQAGPGWVLASYVPAAKAGDATVPQSVAVLLSAPDGSLYELFRLPTDPAADGSSWTDTDVLEWYPEDRTALVTRSVRAWSDLYGWWDSDSSTLATLDLATGTVTATPGTALPLGSYRGRSTAGHVWASYDGDRGDVITVVDAAGRRTEAVSPDGTVDGDLLSPERDRILAGSYVVDLTTGAVSQVPGLAESGCRTISWWTSDSLLLRCVTYPDGSDHPSGTAPRLVELRLDGTMTELRRLADTDVVPAAATRAQWLGDRHVLAIGAPLSTDVCDPSWVMLDIAGQDAATTPLPSADPRGLVFPGPQADGSLVVYGSDPSACGGDAVSASTLTLLDLGSRTARLTVPLPASVGPDGRSNGTGLGGWALWR